MGRKLQTDARAKIATRREQFDNRVPSRQNADRHRVIGLPLAAGSTIGPGHERD